MISASSVVCALGFYSLVLAAVCLLYRLVPPLIVNGGAFILLLVAAVATLRLFLPIELPMTHTIRLWNLMGLPVAFIRAYPDILTLLAVVWVAGVFVFLGWDFVDLCRTYEMSRKYKFDQDECARVQKIAERLSIHYPVMVSPDVNMAYVEGIFRYTIYLPILELPEEEIEFILNHEAQHIRNHDPIIKFLFRILRAFMWWNLLIHWFWHGLDDMLELRCDAKIMEHMDEQQREQYGTMLNGLWEVLTGEDIESTMAVSKLFTLDRKKFMNQRTYIISHGTSKPPRWANIITWCLLAVLFCASYMVIFQPAGEPPAGSFQNDSRTFYKEDYDGPVNDEKANSSFIYIGPDGRYRLFIDYRFIKYLTEDEANSDEYQYFYTFEGSEEK